MILAVLIYSKLHIGILQKAAWIAVNVIVLYVPGTLHVNIYSANQIQTKVFISSPFTNL